MYNLDKRPKMRSECKGGLRPCPWVTCRHHMIWYYVYEKGKGEAGKNLSKKSDDKIAELAISLSETCTLDVTDRGEVTLEVIGDLLGITRERVRQLQDGTKGKGGGAVARMKHHSRADPLRPFVES